MSLFVVVQFECLVQRSCVSIDLHDFFGVSLVWPCSTVWCCLIKTEDGWIYNQLQAEVMNMKHEALY